MELTTEIQIELLKKLQTRLQEIFPFLGKKDAKTELKAEDSAFDPILIYDMVQICVVEDNEKLVYVVGFEKVIPGCRTLPNGDPGYPDDVDFVEMEQVNVVNNLLRTTEIVLICNYKLVVNAASTAREENKMYEEMKINQEEMAKENPPA